MCALSATFRKDLLLACRQPRSVLIGVLLPAAVLIVAALAGTIGQLQAVAVPDDQPAAGRAAYADARYVAALPMDRAAADDLLHSGRAGAVFDSRGPRVGAPREMTMVGGERGDEDLARNTELRLRSAALDVNQRWYAAHALPRVQIAERGLLARDVSDMSYLATGIVVFAALFGGLANTAQLAAREWEENSVRQILAGPRPLWHFVLSKIAAGSLMALLSGAVVLTLTTLAMGVTPAGNWLLIALLLVLLAPLGAAVGAVLGCGLRRIVPAVMGGMVLAVLAWFVGGGFGIVSGLRDWIQWVAWKLPSTYGFSAMQKLVHGPAGGVGDDLTVLAVSTVAALAVCGALAVRLAARPAQGRQ